MFTHLPPWSSNAISAKVAIGLGTTKINYLSKFLKEEIANHAKNRGSFLGGLRDIAVRIFWNSFGASRNISNGQIDDLHKHQEAG